MYVCIPFYVILTSFTLPYTQQCNSTISWSATTIELNDQITINVLLTFTQDKQKQTVPYLSLNVDIHCWSLLLNKELILSKEWRRRLQERRYGKGTKSRTLAVQVGYISLFLSLPSTSAKQQREMSKFCVISLAAVFCIVTQERCVTMKRLRGSSG